MTSYLGEFRANLRPLAAATLGMSFGMGLFAYTSSIFAPYLIEEFHWSRAQYALLGLTLFATVACMVAIGWLTDRFGVRRVAAAGVLMMPTVMLARSMMDGGFTTYILLAIAGNAVSAATSVVVWSRLVAERFVQARGLALTIVTCGPAVVGAIGAPLMGSFVEAHGWRAGYVLMAVVVAVMGGIAVLLAPSRTRLAGGNAEPASRSAGRIAWASFRQAAARPVFWLILLGIMLCNMPAILHASQISLMLIDTGLDRVTVPTMITVYAIGTIVGRLACGIALDKLAPHWVAAVSMGLPAIGFVLLASNYDAVWAIGAAVLLMGLSQGAEGDLIGFLVARHFGVGIYSSVFGLISAGATATVALGSILLSLTLQWSDSYAPFLLITAGTIALGSVLFGLTGTQPVAEEINETSRVGAEP